MVRNISKNGKYEYCYTDKYEPDGEFVVQKLSNLDGTFICCLFFDSKQEALYFIARAS